MVLNILDMTYKKAIYIHVIIPVILELKDGSLLQYKPYEPIAQKSLNSITVVDLYPIWYNISFVNHEYTR
jgi:hypothetical protein